MPVHESDVCVIGGGITAAMLVERLSELKPGLRIAVVEAGRSIFDRQNRGTYHRRALLDEAFKAAEVRNLPSRPDGRHVVADLMTHYFRSSGANDLCYNARIGRNTYRAIRVTTVRPEPLRRP